MAPVSRVADVYRYDGPHTPDTVKAAARDVADLVGYLANATGTVDLDPPDLARIVDEIRTAVSELPQLLTHLADKARRYTTVDGLYDNQGGDAHALADLLNLHLLAAAHGMPSQMLATAHEAASRLGTNQPEGGTR